MTISFLGNVSKNDIQKLIKLLDKISFHGSFNIYVEKTGIFQSNKLQKIFWLGIGNGINKISALNQKIEKDLSFNVKKKADNYSPHITIGRLKTSHGKIDVLPFLKYVYSPIEFNVNALYLYESLLHQNGAKYKVINKFPLNRSRKESHGGTAKRENIRFSHIAN